MQGDWGLDGQNNLCRKATNPAAIQRDEQVPYRTDAARELGAAMRVRDAEENHGHEHGAEVGIHLLGGATAHESDQRWKMLHWIDPART